MIGRLLCRFGYHRWTYRYTFAYGASFDVCDRCEAQRRTA